MSEVETAPSNGHAETFSVGAILDLAVPFEFPFEGQVLKGRWYKYKTTTREYIKARVTERNDQLTRYRDLQTQIETLADDDTRIVAMTAECEQLEEAVQRTNYSWLTDAIIEWNAVGRDQRLIPITAASFAEIPVPFLVALDQFLVDSRTDKNPTSSGS